MNEITSLKITPVSMVTHDGFQKVTLEYHCKRIIHTTLTVYRDNEGKTDMVAGNIPVAFDSGYGKTSILLPVQKEDFMAYFVFTDKKGNEILKMQSVWNKPVERTMYIMLSSHTDIGLHNSQYIQRYNSSHFLDEAMRLCDITENEDSLNQYRYIIEGTWFYNNYVSDRSSEELQNLIDNYIKKDKIGICSTVAGNHIQTYGLEEMCRSTYERKKLFETYGINSETLCMIDNNGLPMSMIQSYADAGYKNILFSPNQWNPLPSSLWEMNRRYDGCTWSPEASGGGSRIDVRFSSELPMVFYWEDSNKNRLLVWATAQYDTGCENFGIYHTRSNNIDVTEQRMAETLSLLDRKHPFKIWLMACYGDDEYPNTNVVTLINEWNRKWKYPKLRTLGNPDEPFELLRKFHDDEIPVLHGDITGGWYQHPASVAELLSQKFEADRLLPTAEKWSVIASLVDKSYEYPSVDFERAWNCLLYNDEHSYGTSGYQGRRVYETWIQHRDWITKAENTGRKELSKAICAVASKINADESKTIVFNQTLQTRTELIEKDGKYVLAEIPPFGYKALSDNDFITAENKPFTSDTPPVIENSFYRVMFAENGSISSIYDKQFERELINTENGKANELLYTRDNHKTFTTPEKATFTVCENAFKITVIIKTIHTELKAELVSRICLPCHEKRIDIDNRIYHASDMINKNRYYRYLYYAFPFAVTNARRLCHMNGDVAEYAKDVTGHGTDVYMAVNEWCLCQNDKFGVALMMLDSLLVEFDHIHPDKTDFGDAGDGSDIFVYCANDWLQMHCPGGCHLDYKFRFSITSYSGSYEKAGVPQMSERFANPINVTTINPQNGIWQENCKSFMDFDANLRFTALKPADDGNGIIARFYGKYHDMHIDKIADIDVAAVKSTVDEKDCSDKKSDGFITYRLCAEDISICKKMPQEQICDNSKPSPIGSVYTGLITDPRAGFGELSGHLYLLWGYNNDPDFSHYKLYRSESSDFICDETTFVADVYPEEYVVGRYEDKGLKSHTCYYYRVCAVNNKGICGEMSDEFSAYTREDI